MNVMIPWGGLNGDINACIYSILNQTVYIEKIHVLIDYDNTSPQIANYIYEIAKHRRISLVIETCTTKISILSMRFYLMKNNRGKSFFIDSDIILRYDALEKMIDLWNTAIDNPLEKSKCVFVEGMRLEMGGRKNKDFSKEAKQVSEDKKLESNIIYCGDTALLLLDCEHFIKNVPWEDLFDIWNKPGIGGSDFAMTMVGTSSPGFYGLACPEAIGYHLASPEKGYWNNYAASDQILQRVIPDKLKGIKKDLYLERIANVFK
jgi:hypothetical protein